MLSPAQRRPPNWSTSFEIALRHHTVPHRTVHCAQVCYPKPTDKPLYANLVKQCQALGVPFVTVDELRSGPLRASYDVVIDALFGFSFQGAPRPPFDAILQASAPHYPN